MNCLIESEYISGLSLSTYLFPNELPNWKRIYKCTFPFHLYIYIFPNELPNWKQIFKRTVHFHFYIPKWIAQLKTNIQVDFPFPLIYSQMNCPIENENLSHVKYFLRCKKGIFYGMVASFSLAALWHEAPLSAHFAWVHEALLGFAFAFAILLEPFPVPNLSSFAKPGHIRLVKEMDSSFLELKGLCLESRNRTIHVEAISRQRGLMVLHALWAWGLVALCLVCGPRCGALVQATSGPRRPRHDSGLETWVPPKQQPITLLFTFPLPAANSVHEIQCITSVESGSRVYSLQHVYTFWRAFSSSVPNTHCSQRDTAWNCFRERDTICKGHMMRTAKMWPSARGHW